MAYCANCGKEISPQALSCPQCGHPGARAGVQIAAGARTYEGFAIASLACSIASFLVIPVVGSILGIVFGRMAQGRIAANPALEGEGLARSGIIVGWVGIGLAAAFVVFSILLVAVFSSISFK